jgi:hypothetical protein
VHDFYRRFVKRDSTEQHYVLAGRIVTILLFIFSSSLVFVLETAKDSFDVILQVGAGTGLLYLIRWFWWRVNAWSEVAAMVSSFAVSIIILILNKNGAAITTHAALLITIAVTTVCWVTTALFGPETDRATLISFYKKVRPFGPGWKKIREEAGVSEQEARATHENIPMALLGWMAGCTVIWSSLFAVGNFLYGRMEYAVGLLVVFLISGGVLLFVINRLWPGAREPQQ